MTKKQEYQKEYSRKWRARNQDKIKAYRVANRERNNEYQKKYRNPFFTLYYLPRCNYVGITNSPVKRMNNHSVSGKDVSSWVTIKTYTNKREALDAEAFYHSIGYEGYGRQNQLKNNPII
tara:strand:+ start:134 stop:493 length:360 start_codon:yes stop_codon:yes gene_type:complete